VVVLASNDVHGAWKWAGLPEAARLPPAGWGWATELLPPALPLARAVYFAFLGACVLGLVGLFTRPAATVAALTGAWLLGLAGLSGQVMHTHHLVWFLALLAGSPCGDALSIDRFLKRRRGLPPPPASLAHGLPIRLAWVAIGLVFFFPGIWKLLDGGAGWVTGDALARQMRWKWLETGVAPGWRLDQHPCLLHLCGALAIAFELLFLPAVLYRRTRGPAVAAALSFHAVIRATMGISFSSLWACYTVFVPWAKWLGLTPLPALDREPLRRWAPAAALGAALLGAQLVTGALGLEQTWPVACYPTFRGVPSSRIEWVEADEVTARGTTSALGLADLRGPDGQRWWGVNWRLLRAPGAGALQAHFLARKGAPGAETTEVVFYRASMELDREGAVDRELLARWTPTPPR